MQVMSMGFKCLDSINTLLRHMEVFLTTTTGVPRRTMQTTRGTRTSTMGIRTTTTGITKTGLGLYGVLDKPVPGKAKEPDPAHFSGYTQLNLFSPYVIPLEKVFQAYYSCRKHKRNTRGAMAFEIDLEENIVELWKQLNEGTYQIGRSTVFIVEQPVKREIFAASFRDRIVHHLIINALNPVLEKRLVYDVYACREGKGSHLAIKRLDHFMCSCSDNYQREGWVLKLDVRSFFMSIDKHILWESLVGYVRVHYFGQDRELLLKLCHLIVFNDPTHGCIFRSPRSSWGGLPKGKSLFFAKKGCGLPIGNLTSQVFANFYLSSLDHFIKHNLGIRFYGRYVDDFVLVHESRHYLVECIRHIRQFLQTDLHLELHPKKIRLQRICHGVSFLGWSLQVGHINGGSRTIRNWKKLVKQENALIEDHRPSREDQLAFRSSMNSYLGILSHYNTFRVRGGVISTLDSRWGSFFYLEPKKKKVIARK
jgi:RNA-directed DNA polymerase